MQKKKGWAYSNDLDAISLLGDIGWDDEGTEVNDNEVEDVDVFGTEDKTPEVKPEPTPAPEVKTEDTTLPTPEPKSEEVSDKKEGDEDLDKWLDDLLKSNAEVDDKVTEIKDAIEESWDDSTKQLVDELQTMIADKNLEIEQLKKQVDVTQSRYISKFGEWEELSIYKPEIEKLQNNPRLMALVKYGDTENEKIKPKVISILSDMIYKLTGQDVSMLLDEKDKANMSILNSPSSDNQPIQENKKPEEKNMDYDESINNILWL